MAPDERGPMKLLLEEKEDSVRISPGIGIIAGIARKWMGSPA